MNHKHKTTNLTRYVKYNIPHKLIMLRWTGVNL